MQATKLALPAQALFVKLSLNQTMRKVSYFVALTFIVALSYVLTIEIANALTVSATGTITAATGSQSTAATMTSGGNVLQQPLFWLLNFLKGTGGLFAAVLALLFTIFEAFVRKNLVGAILSFAVALVALYGPGILTTFFGASL